MKEQPAISKKQKKLLAKDRCFCKNCINFIALKTRKDIGVCDAILGFYKTDFHCVLFKDKENV